MGVNSCVRQGRYIPRDCRAEPRVFAFHWSKLPLAPLSARGVFLVPLISKWQFNCSRYCRVAGDCEGCRARRACASLRESTENDTVGQGDKFIVRQSSSRLEERREDRLERTKLIWSRQIVTTRRIGALGASRTSVDIRRLIVLLPCYTPWQIAGTMKTISDRTERAGCPSFSVLNGWYCALVPAADFFGCRPRRKGPPSEIAERRTSRTVSGMTVRLSARN